MSVDTELEKVLESIPGVTRAGNLRPTDIGWHACAVLEETQRGWDALRLLAGIYDIHVDARTSDGDIILGIESTDRYPAEQFIADLRKLVSDARRAAGPGKEFSISFEGWLHPPAGCPEGTTLMEMATDPEVVAAMKRKYPEGFTAEELAEEMLLRMKNRGEER
jgi:hypothetical protein